MTTAIDWLGFTLILVLLPVLTVGLIRKTKARLQNRIGPPLFQPLFHLVKLFRKGQVFSEDASWLFRAGTALWLAALMVIAFLVPWVSFKPAVAGDDIFLVVYLFAFVRFWTVLAAMDPGSPFGGFAASRDVTLSLLVEPALVLGLTSLAVLSGSTSFASMFSVGLPHTVAAMPVWLLAGAALFLSSLAELSRMPLDDPTTHLELTMIHEAMTIESSGRNLALAELGYSLRLVILYGLTVQCLLHGFLCLYPCSAVTLAVMSVAGVLLLAVVTAFIETVFVKLRWSKVPEFVAYAITMSLLAAFAAVVTRGIGR